ncbi:MAG: O-antigen ligase family protein [Chloroflexi bacterium]|nr:O-antigen ligase family protein [Chloroflexota bacterium]
MCSERTDALHRETLPQEAPAAAAPRPGGIVDTLIVLEPVYFVPLWVLLILSAIAPSAIVCIALVVLPLPWALRLFRYGRLSVGTSLDLPWAVFFLSALVGLAVSPEPRLSLERLSGILGGIALYYLIVNSPNEGYVKGYIACFALASVAIAIWSFRQSPFSAFDGSQLLWAVEMAHRVIPGVSSIAVHPNGVAGITAPVLPLLASLALLAGHTGAPSRDEYGAGERATTSAPHRRHRPDPLQACCAISSVVLLLVLLLTNSRGGFIALVAGLAICAIAIDRRIVLLLPVLVTSGYVLVVKLVSSPERLLDTATGVSRLQAWQSAYCMVQDFFYTGAGLAAFPYIYPYYASPSNPSSLTNVHNAYLQTYLDQGLLGFLSWTAMLVVVGTTIARTIRRHRGAGLQYAIGVGLAGSLAALVVQGMFEASVSVVYGDASGVLHVVTSPLPYFLSGLAVRVARDEGFLLAGYRRRRQKSQPAMTAVSATSPEFQPAVAHSDVHRAGGQSEDHDTDHLPR